MAQEQTGNQPRTNELAEIREMNTTGVDQVRSKKTCGCEVGSDCVCEVHRHRCSFV